MAEVQQTKKHTLCRVKLLSEMVHLIERNSQMNVVRSLLSLPIRLILPNSALEVWVCISNYSLLGTRWKRHLCVIDYLGRRCYHRNREPNSEQGYNTLLYKYGTVSAELLMPHLQRIGSTPTTLFILSAEELKVQ